MHNHSYENEFNLHVNGISFSYERMGTKTRFEKEAKGNSEMAYCNQVGTTKMHHVNRFCCPGRERKRGVVEGKAKKRQGV